MLCVTLAVVHDQAVARHIVGDRYPGVVPHHAGAAAYVGKVGEQGALEVRPIPDVGQAVEPERRSEANSVGPAGRTVVPLEELNEIGVQ
jgi:hypothetical protein